MNGSFSSDHWVLPRRWLWLYSNFRRDGARWMGEISGTSNSCPRNPFQMSSSVCDHIIPHTIIGHRISTGKSIESIVDKARTIFSIWKKVETEHGTLNEIKFDFLLGTNLNNIFTFFYERTIDNIRLYDGFISLKFVNSIVKGQI